MRVVRPVDRQIDRLVKAKRVAERYGNVHMIEAASRAIEEQKREKRFRIRRVQTRGCGNTRLDNFGLIG